MKTYRIVAPICSVDEIEPVLEAGASEVYFGIMPEKWEREYGSMDFITRRQNRQAHIASYDDLKEIVHIVNDRNATATLVLNAGYSSNQIPFVFEILKQWETCGGHAVMVYDIEILLWLNSTGSKLERQLSVMSGVFNSHSIDFFKQFNISRVVLPRELSLSEIDEFVRSAGQEVGYESIVMFQKCEFIDAFCQFYHAVCYQPYVVENCSGLSGKYLPVIESYDPYYEGHGCQMDFLCKNRKIKHLENNDFQTPYCAACSLDFLLKKGVNNLKIAGRGYPVKLIADTVRFIKRTIERPATQSDMIKSDYLLTFGCTCQLMNCYYQ
ncbi:MAG: U32 family peptidase [Tannerella sp.]|jgi:putative protease|nr:U32 family peptidase [Tannerella sp.]